MKHHIIYISLIIAIGYLCYLQGFNSNHDKINFVSAKGVGTLDGIPIKYDVSNPDSVVFMFDHEVPVGAIELTEEQRMRLKATLNNISDTTILAQQIKMVLSNNYYTN